MSHDSMIKEKTEIKKSQQDKRKSKKATYVHKSNLSVGLS